MNGQMADWEVQIREVSQKLRDLCKEFAEENHVSMKRSLECLTISIHSYSYAYDIIRESMLEILEDKDLLEKE